MTMLESKPRKVAKKKVDGPSAAILWTLKLDGDINETHAGGKPLPVLKERLEARGFKLDERKNTLAAALYTLEKMERIIRVRKGSQVYAIRLNRRDPIIFPPNPFAGTELVPVEDKKPAKKGAEPDYLTFSIDQRLELIAAISESIRRDVEAFKSGVMEAL